MTKEELLKKNAAIRAQRKQNEENKIVKKPTSKKNKKKTDKVAEIPQNRAYMVSEEEMEEAMFVAEALSLVDKTPEEIEIEKENAVLEAECEMIMQGK